MYFPDLTPYEYASAKKQPNVLNVGWLSSAHPFRSGVPDDRLIEALRYLVANPVNLFRGGHFCEFCPPSPTKLSPNIAGNGEIQVTNASGVTYVAPVLILHYVAVHGYRPPQEFIDAVLAQAGA
jgi:hypothetical protein